MKLDFIKIPIPKYKMAKVKKKKGGENAIKK